METVHHDTPSTLVLLSDTHGRHEDLHVPDGDLLLHAGDLTSDGTLESLAHFNAWLQTLPHPHKVVIAGNHDFCLQHQPAKARTLLTACHYLEDEAISLAGLRIYGTPWQPWFLDFAFNLKDPAERRAKWDLIPGDLDILLTHSPPHGLLDQTNGGVHAGCEELTLSLARVRPPLHVFGHIHEAAGQRTRDGTLYVNAALTDTALEIVREPVVLRWPLPRRPE